MKTSFIISYSKNHIRKIITISEFNSILLKQNSHLYITLIYNNHYTLYNKYISLYNSSITVFFLNQIPTPRCGASYVRQALSCCTLQFTSQLRSLSYLQQKSWYSLSYLQQKRFLLSNLQQQSWHHCHIYGKEIVFTVIFTAKKLYSPSHLQQKSSVTVIFTAEMVTRRIKDGREKDGRREEIPSCNTVM